MAVRLAAFLSLALLAGWPAPSWGQPCFPTRPDLLGPYYISGMPVAHSLVRFDRAGEPLHVEGEIRSSEPPHSPVAGARVEIWQADGEGRYHPPRNGDAAEFPDEVLDLRGTVIANENGAYTVMSVVPAHYQSRPPHLHFRIGAPGYQTLVTQLYIDVGNSGPRCRTAELNRTGAVARFHSPAIYLLPE